MFKNITSWFRVLGFGRGQIALTAKKSYPKIFQRLQNATTIPLNKTSVVTSPSIVPMISPLISEKEENNDRRDSNQAQEKAMNNKQKEDEEEKFWAKVFAKTQRQEAARPDPFDCVDVPTASEYLEMFANFDLKSSTSGSFDEISDIIWAPTIRGFPTTDSIEFGRGLVLFPILLDDGSLNNEETPPDADILDYTVRTITIVLYSGLQISFNAFVLGRLWVNNLPSYWVICLDEEKHFWALRATGIDEDEAELVDEDEEELCSEYEWGEDYQRPARRCEEQKDLFGTDVLVVKLCSIASLQHFRKSGEQFSPEPYYDAKCWTSMFALAKAPATAAAEES